MKENSSTIQAEKNYGKRNTYCFGLGTIGRDMFYTVVSMFMMVYLTEVLDLPDSTMWVMTIILTVMRVFDAVNDPLMGMIVDNTKGRFGKFKPWIAIGGIVGGALMILMFTDFGMTGVTYYVFFAVIYAGWDIMYGLNDIAYWSMLPTLSTNQKEREKIGSFARICANIGLFVVVATIIPVTNALGNAAGDLVKGWNVYAILIALIMLATISITIFGVKEKKGVFKQEEKTTLKGMFKAIFQNDQLLVTAISMALFMIGYVTTTSFGVYFFKYAYGEENMYSAFAVVLGVAQVIALAVFPQFSKRFTRKQLYTGAIFMIIAGYLLFFFSPMNMIPIGIAGVLIFAGEAFIQLLMLMFLADTIEYGQWKSGKRNESVTFSIQPFINKIGGALANGILGVTLILSGINNAQVPGDVTAGGLWMMKASMFLIPLALIIVGYVIYVKKFKIDEKTYQQILSDLEKRGDIKEEGETTES